MKVIRIKFLGRSYDVLRGIIFNDSGFVVALCLIPVCDIIFDTTDNPFEQNLTFLY